MMRWQKLLLGEDSCKSPLHQDLIPGPMQRKNSASSTENNHFKISEDTVSDFSYIMKRHPK